MKIKSLAIANRGEVAVRIIHACQELGIETVLLHSEADVSTRAYRMADRTICIGPAQVSESYLNIPNVMRALLASGVDAVHPGFGFLSENSDFVREIEKAKILFVGPNSQSMQMLGNKVDCKKLAEKAGVPLIPGYKGEDQSVAYLIKKCNDIGYPVIVKAAMGGGGRGMKVIRNPDEAAQQIESAQREAQVAFGSSQVFLEKYLDRAKHIEFQVFVDSTGSVVHLFDRECSVQRRHQKIIEEAISPSLTPLVRQKMSECATRLVGLTDYRGAATVEFLLQDEKFYLLEVNTRLQVEHPVTEEVMCVDLVKMQILTAAGDCIVTQEKLGLPKGYAIECRIYAEDPFLGGVPSTGKLGLVKWPEGPHRRFEYGIEEGDEVTSYYDPMIAKAIVWDETRERAILKMRQVLKESIVFGVQTNIPFLLEILNHPEYIKGDHTTQFINKYFSNPLPPIELSNEEKEQVAHLMKVTPKSFSSLRADQVTGQASPFQMPWRMG
jgi:3-methylcrotonyl-CoA carboxylase alpha subunit